jgi:hypothetical protein
MISGYRDFLITSGGASAAFIGLLFVSLSVAASRGGDHATRERRIVLGGSASLALFDIFVVSIAALLGGDVNFAILNVLMACVGFWGVSNLLPRSIRAGNLRRGAPHRSLNIAFAAVSVGLYIVQFLLGIALLLDVQSDTILRAQLYTLVALYASALSRAWEITWIRPTDIEVVTVPADAPETRP